MNMKKLAVILAAIALVPGVALADDLSANLTGGGQGFASLVTSGTTITYGIVTNGIGTPNGAQILQGGNVLVDLQAGFSNGSASGSVNTSSANIDALNNNSGNFTLRVQGNGNITGTLRNNGGSGGGTAGTIEVGSATYSVIETGGQATVTVNRVGGDAGVATVDYTTSNGTATAGTDYQATNGTLTWADGESGVMTFDVPVFDNAMEDGTRTVNLTLSNNTGADLGLANATLDIVDDEGLTCTPDSDTLCLNTDGRFKAEVTWRDFQGNTGSGETFEIGLQDSGLFFFFSQDNIEMLLKVLDACNSQFNAYWVFYAATTNVEFELTVTDTATGTVQTYKNALGNPAAPVLDTAAFSTCP